MLSQRRTPVCPWSKPIREFLSWFLGPHFIHSNRRPRLAVCFRAEQKGAKEVFVFISQGWGRLVKALVTEHNTCLKNCDSLPECPVRIDNKAHCQNIILVAIVFSSLKYSEVYQISFFFFRAPREMQLEAGERPSFLLSSQRTSVGRFIAVLRGRLAGCIHG